MSDVKREIVKSVKNDVPRATPSPLPFQSALGTCATEETSAWRVCLHVPRGFRIVVRPGTRTGPPVNIKRPLSAHSMPFPPPARDPNSARGSAAMSSTDDAAALLLPVALAALAFEPLWRSLTLTATDVWSHLQLTIQSLRHPRRSHCPASPSPSESAIMSEAAVAVQCPRIAVQHCTRPTLRTHRHSLQLAAMQPRSSPLTRKLGNSPDHGHLLSSHTPACRATPSTSTRSVTHSPRLRPRNAHP
jgi:hypothetical protein